MSDLRGVLPTAADAQRFGADLGRMLRAGDIVLLTGGLGAGKTTLTQGLAQGLGVRGPITSPTFVIARIHPSLTGGPALIHADAYRLGGSAELEDLDLDTDVERAVTVVEWGAGVAESLGEHRLEVSLRVVLQGTMEGMGSSEDDSAGGAREIRVRTVGARWSAPQTREQLAALVAGGSQW